MRAKERGGSGRSIDGRGVTGDGLQLHFDVPRLRRLLAASQVKFRRLWLRLRRGMVPGGLVGRGEGGAALSLSWGASYL